MHALYHVHFNVSNAGSAHDFPFHHFIQSTLILINYSAEALLYLELPLCPLDMNFQPLLFVML